jgi:hypothetical protein
MSDLVNKDTHLRELIFESFNGKSFSPVDVAEACGRDLRSVRTSLQRFTRANYVIRNKRGEYVLNGGHPQVIKLSGGPAASIEKPAGEALHVVPAVEAEATTSA